MSGMAVEQQVGRAVRANSSTRWSSRAPYGVPCRTDHLHSQSDHQLYITTRAYCY